MTFIGILLAAGRGRRFDPAKERDKLLQPLGNGELVVTAAARTMLAVLPEVVAVVRPGAEALTSRLREVGCRITVCADADEGMGASLAHAINNAREAEGWVIALGDMPYVQERTLHALLDALRNGATIAAPVYRDRRGNPVAFGREHLQDLLRLHGDEGARRLLAALPIEKVPVEDAGIHKDIDRVEDIANSSGVE